VWVKHKEFLILKRDPFADPSDIYKDLKSEITGVSYKLHTSSMQDFLHVVLGLNNVPEELRNLEPGQTVEVPIF